MSDNEAATALNKARQALFQFIADASSHLLNDAMVKYK